MNLSVSLKQYSYLSILPLLISKKQTNRRIREYKGSADRNIIVSRRFTKRKRSKERNKACERKRERERREEGEERKRDIVFGSASRVTSR